MVFRASLDGIARTFTTVFTLLLLGIVVWQVYLYIDSPQLNSIIASTILLAILFIPYYHHPIRYFIDSECIIVQRPFRSVHINKRKIEFARILQPQEMKDTLRSFGVAGLYGYFGRFSNRNIGSMIWFATQRQNYVLIQTQDRNYVLTPDNPKEFIRELSLR